MNTEIFDINVTAKNVVSHISLTAIDADGYQPSSFGTLIYKATKGEEQYTITFSFDEDNSKINFSLDHTPSLKSICLITCGIGLLGPILDCYKKNRKNWQGFKDCLEGQGHALGTSALACVAACIYD